MGRNSGIEEFDEPRDCSSRSRTYCEEVRDGPNHGTYAAVPGVPNASYHGTNLVIGGRGRGRGRKKFLVTAVDEVLSQAPAPTDETCSVLSRPRVISNRTRSPLHELSKQNTFAQTHIETPNKNAQGQSIRRSAHTETLMHTNPTTWEQREGAPDPLSSTGRLPTDTADTESRNLTLLKRKMLSRLQRRRERLGLQPVISLVNEEQQKNPHNNEGQFPPKEERIPPRYIHMPQQEEQNSPITVQTVMEQRGDGTAITMSDQQFFRDDRDHHPPQSGSDDGLNHHSNTPRNNRVGQGVDASRGGARHESAVLNAGGYSDERQQPHHRHEAHNDRYDAPGHGQEDHSNHQGRGQILSTSKHRGPYFQENRTDDRSLEKSAIKEEERLAQPQAKESEKSEYVKIETFRCDCCGRSFGKPAYEKHFDINGNAKCENNSKRKVFNSAKVREG